MKINETCEACLLGKHLNKYPENASSETVSSYQEELKSIITQNRELSAPEIVSEIERLYRRYFGGEKEYTAIKKHFNEMMLSLEPQILRSASDSKDPLMRAVQYAMAGNFIDFGALGNVDENKLELLIAAADKAEVDISVLDGLRGEIMRAKRMVYFTDNCGEIVADKVLLRIIRKMNPELHITAIVRGAPVLNDATMEDAIQVGLDGVVNELFGNGCAIAGNVLEKVSKQALDAANAADLLIAKGQGNYESLCGCGLNIYYIFMCKCSLFVDRFKVPLYSGIIIKET